MNRGPVVDNNDKRIFNRYSTSSAVDLEYNNKLVKGEIFDYSLTGIGAKITGIPRFAKGDVVSFRAPGSEMKMTGEVMWVQAEALGFRIGIRNIGQMQGLLRDFMFADTLLGLQRSQKTGILTVYSGSITKKVYIRNGDMIFSRSNQEEDRLGDLLLIKGAITPDQYDHSVRELKNTKQRQGAILVRLGYLKPDELVHAVRHHAEHIIKSIFSLEDGSFVFDEGPLPTDEIITLSLSAANLIYYGIMNIRNMDVIRGQLPSGDVIPWFTSKPIDLFQNIKLDDAGRKVVSCIDNKTTVREIISITRLDEDELLKVLYALTSVRMIEVKSQHETAAEMPKEFIDGIIEAEEMPAMDPNVREMIEDMHVRYKNLGYYNILGVKDHAPLAEIKAAYYRTAKKFHPDIHFSLADESVKSKLSDIFSYVYEAYVTLTDSEMRKDYDRTAHLKSAGPASTRDKARAAFAEGKIQFKRENYTEAGLLFGQATYFDGSIAEYHYYYGLTLIRQNKFKAAEKAIGRALSLEPANAAYMAEQGFVFLELGLPVRARGLFEKALQISPDNIRASEGILKIRGV